MRALLTACCAAALLPAPASEILVSRAQALCDSSAAAPDAAMPPALTAVCQLAADGTELIATACGGGAQRARAAVYLEEPARTGRYRLLKRIASAQSGPGFAQPQILHPLVGAGPEQAWLVRFSRPTGGNGGWMEERLLSLRGAGTPAPALDEVDFVTAPQAYQPFLAPGEAVLSAEWNDLAATPMAFRFRICGPHDPHVDPHGGVVTGSYRLSEDATRPGCYRLEPERFARTAAAPRAER